MNEEIKKLKDSIMTMQEMLEKVEQMTEEEKEIFFEGVEDLEEPPGWEEE